MSSHPPRSDRFGWCVYDWANSAFATTVLAAVLPVYFAEWVVPPEGAALTWFGLDTVLSATSLWGYANGLVSILVILTAPVLGGIADFSSRKKLFLMTGAYAGALATLGLGFCGAGDVQGTLLLFCIGQYAFVSANVFYDAFLPFLATGRDMDRLSGQGYALGYLGGGLLLLLNVLFIHFHQAFGVDQEVAVRLSLASAGVWWGGFSTVTLFMLRERSASVSVRTGLSFSVRKGFSSLRETVLHIVRRRNLLLFLVAYMIYNDGVQTIIKMAAIFGKEELGLSSSTLLGTFLMVQFVGIAGALGMSRAAETLGVRRTILLALAVWLGLTLFAFRMRTPGEYWIMGLVVGLILGGTQALSRSFYARLVTRERAAQLFGFFSVFSKFSAVWGPILFALIRQLTGTARLSILSVSVFFLVGGAILCFVKER